MTARTDHGHRPRTTRARPRRLAGAAALGVALVLVAAACHPADARATFTVADQWGGGYTASLEVTNTADEPLPGWRLSFVTPDDLGSMWNATLVDRTTVDGGWRYTLAGPSWQPDLPVGATASVGFTATISGTTPATPTACRLDDEPIHCDTAALTTSTTGVPSTTTSTTVATTSTSSPPDPTGGIDLAPYLDVTLWPPPDLDVLAASRDLDLLTLAFVVTGDAPCTPAWGGVVPIGDDHLADEVAQLRAGGGDVIVSFGGALGTELAQSCDSVDQLVAAYRQTIDRYGATSIDVDVEGGALGDSAANDRRSEALARLQADAAAEGRTLAVSLTLPVLPSGLTPASVAVVQSAAAAGVDLDVVNIMAMDYGAGSAPDPDGQMGAYAIAAASATHAQLGAVLPEASVAERWALVGVTPMIGQNDVAGEVFREADARQLRAFAEDVELGRLSMWSVTRDTACPGGPSPWASATCSGIDQQPGAFGAILDGR